MRALPWVIAGVGVAVGAAVMMLNGSTAEPAYASGYDGYDGVERAARKSFGWGTKRRAEGKVESFTGAIKQGVGRLTGDDEMAGEGTADRFVGNLKDAAGQLGESAGQTIHDLNQ